jgi:hypothetical protein
MPNGPAKFGMNQGLSLEEFPSCPSLVLRIRTHFTGDPASGEILNSPIGPNPESHFQATSTSSKCEGCGISSPSSRMADSGHAAWEIGSIGSIAGARFFKKNQVSAHSKPACFSIDLRVFGGTSSDSCPATVTFPAFKGWTNCLANFHKPLPLDP